MSDHVLLFIGRPGAVELVERRPRPGGGEVWWRMPGSQLANGPYRTRFAALLDAAHACKMSGRRADFRQVEV